MEEATRAYARAATQWSRGLQAREGTDSQRLQALTPLCEDYRCPLYAFIRHQGRETGAGLTPEQAFERRWALTVVEKSLLRLCAESDDG